MFNIMLMLIVKLHKTNMYHDTQATTGTDADDIYQAVLEKLPNYVQAVHDLPDRREHYPGSHWLSEAEWDIAKEHTIEFNDVFRDIIEANPQLQFDDIVAIVDSVANRLEYSDETKEMVRHNTKGILYGMRHEVAFEQILNQLPDNFQIVTTDDEDDAHGADFKVRCPNGIIISIDVKASERLEEEAERRTAIYMRRHHKKAPANEIVLFSGFEDEDFAPENPWRPTQAAIERELPHIKEELLRASDKHASSKRHQRQATY